MGTRSLIEGQFIGVEVFSVGFDGDVIFYTTAQTGLIEAGEIVRVIIYGLKRN